MENIITLDDREYFYLNERFDVMSESDVKEMPRYIVNSRKDKLKSLISVAVECELNDEEREYVLDRYRELLNVSQIAKKHSVSRQRVYRVLDNARSKLFNALKYAYYCGFSLVEPIRDFDALLKKVKKETSDADDYHTD